MRSCSSCCCCFCSTRGSTLFDLPESAGRDEGGRSLRTLGLPALPRALPALPGALPAALAGALPLLTGGFTGRLGGFAGEVLSTDGGRLLLLFCTSRRSFGTLPCLFCTLRR